MVFLVEEMILSDEGTQQGSSCVSASPNTMKELRELNDAQKDLL